ncbi:hypothetical protein MKK84_23515 [Methylobacterium sp. E-065]|uniref:hypothetical protein n=1 Tax=Methylobacterium sp. E-065 TaxID=2836583 RepID=UPI001FB9D455|nr:hypothetical protein [Methylobacterium sp. E-065]MCJ2020363.1 hypothetical protein [Methylobacterium sp. E-065]
MSSRNNGRGTASTIIDPRWLKLGISTALGVVAGTMLFATEAHGRSDRRTERLPGRRGSSDRVGR